MFPIRIPYGTIGAQSLAEQTLPDVAGDEPEPGQPNDLVEHWVRAIDRWVERLDQGMGGTTEGTDPAAEPDSAPEAGDHA